jgi:signal transduction histidine kinase
MRHRSEGSRRGTREERRLLRRTFLVAFLLMSGGLLSSSAIELVFRYRESVEGLHAVQQEIAHSAALQVQQFIAEIHQRLRAATHTPATITAGLTEAYRFELRKLLHMAPAITHAVVLDATGHERYKVSREQMILPADLADRARDTAFVQAQTGTTFFGPVYFVHQSEPYMYMAVPIERIAGQIIGVLMAEVNLTYIWEVITRITVGQTGYAYVVARTGDLIAHPDLSLVLQQQNLAHLDQVQAALAGVPGSVTQTNQHGESVLTTSAAIPLVGWVVIVERLVREAYAPLYRSLFRTAALCLLGLGMAGLVRVVIHRRVIRPVEVLRQGVAQIGAGALHYRLDVRTGDELQALADAFNQMAAHLQASYTDLEAKVAARTRELETTNQHLATANQHKSQFLATMSHELRTPLHAILGYTRLILDRIYGEIPPLIAEKLERVHQSGQHLLTLINAVLDLSRIESGRLVLSLTQYAMAEVVSTVVTTVESLATAKQLRLTVAMPTDLPRGTGDAPRLTQVLFNLVGNAIAFTEVGEVSIDVSVSDDTFTLVVRDTGPGIRPEDQQRIFAPFQQVDNASTRTHNGTGLGLAIAKQIVEMHGGHIGVRSCPGQGATFWFTVPRRVAHPGRADADTDPGD